MTSNGIDSTRCYAREMNNDERSLHEIAAEYARLFADAATGRASTLGVLARTARLTFRVTVGERLRSWRRSRATKPVTIVMSSLAPKRQP